MKKLGTFIRKAVVIMLFVSILGTSSNSVNTGIMTCGNDSDWIMVVK